MKKIVHVVEAFGGGVFTYLADLTSGLVGKYDVYILYGKRKQTPENFQNYFDKRVKFIRINNFTRGMNLCKDFAAYCEVNRYINSLKPDIIHLHSSKAGGIGRLIKYNGKQKVFYTPHGYSFLDSGNGEMKLKAKIYFQLERILGKKNATTIACSYGEYIESEKVTKNAIFINNSVNSKELLNYETKNSNTQKVIFTIGRISDQKNPKLFNSIAKRLPNTKFVWVGDGPQRNLLTAKNIEVTGWLKRSSVLRLIQPYEYFILTSKWEGLPISLLEAMFFSKICFVTNIIGNKNVITDASDGYIFNNEIDFLSKFKNFEKKVGPKANEIIRKKFSREEMIGEYVNAYEKLNQ